MPAVQKPEVRAKIRRLYVPKATYFITCVTKNRQPHFRYDSRINLLRETLRIVQSLHPFKMKAYVFLNDHFHLLITLISDTNITKLSQSIQRNYTLNFKKSKKINEPLRLWQRGFWDHVIRNDKDFRNHIHYIHYNPVKHGFATHPEDYPHSSYMEYVKRRWYEIGWGWNEPEEVTGLDFE